MTTRATLILCCALSAWVAGPAAAEVVRLLDGRLLQGRIVSHNGVEVVLERWDNGGQVTIPFKEMLDTDRKRLEKKFNYRSVEDFLVKTAATRLTLKNSIDRPIGVMNKDKSDDKSIVLERRGVPYTYQRGLIEKIEEVRVAETEVYLPQQIYDRRLAEITRKEEAGEAVDPRDHFELARYVEKLGLFEEAVAHFQKASELDPTNYELKSNEAVERLQLLIANRDALKGYRRVLSAKSMHKYTTARERLEALKTDYGAKEDIFPKGFDALAAEIDAEEAEYLNGQLMRYLHTTARNLAYEMARKPQTTADAGLAYGRGEMHAELLAKLAEKLEVDDKKIKSVFDNRQTRRTHKIALGNATFMVQGGGGGGGGGGRGGRGAGGRGGTVNIGGRKVNIGQLLGRGGGASRGGQSANPRDTLWNASDVRSRRHLIYAAWAIKNLEVVKEDEVACSKCGGKGTVTSYTKQGNKQGNQKTTCPRCHGTRVDKTYHVK